jgi:hypothetical protein
VHPHPKPARWDLGTLAGRGLDRNTWMVRGTGPFPVTVPCATGGPHSLSR